MLAAYHGHAELVKHLVLHGADPNRCNDRNQSPLAGAVFKMEDAVIEVSSTCEAVTELLSNADDRARPSSRPERIPTTAPHLRCSVLLCSSRRRSGRLSLKRRRAGAKQLTPPRVDRERQASVGGEEQRGMVESSSRLLIICRWHRSYWESGYTTMAPILSHFLANSV